MLQQFYSLRSKIEQFLKTKGLLLRKLSDPLWLANLVFSVDLTPHLHTLRKSLQGKEQLVPHLYVRMKAICLRCNYEAFMLHTSALLHTTAFLVDAEVKEPVHLKG